MVTEAVHAVILHSTYGMTMLFSLSLDKDGEKKIKEYHFDETDRRALVGATVHRFESDMALS